MLDIKGSGRMAIKRRNEEIPLILKQGQGFSPYAWGNVVVKLAVE